MTYTITVINQGSLDAYNVEVTDYIPTGMSLSTNDTNGWTVSGTTATNSVANLSAGQQTTLDIVLTVDANFMGTSLVNYAEISAADDDTDATNTPPVDTDSTPDNDCLLYTSPSPRDATLSRMPSSA